MNAVVTDGYDNVNATLIRGNTLTAGGVFREFVLQTAGKELERMAASSSAGLMRNEDQREMWSPA
jgi:hypothetical protein